MSRHVLRNMKTVVALILINGCWFLKAYIYATDVKTQYYVRKYILKGSF